MSRFTTPGWQIQVRERYSLTMGLFARDAAGLRPRMDLHIPPLSPTVDIRSDFARLAGPRTTDEWETWWSRELLRETESGPGLYPPHFPALASCPQLGALVRACFDDAVAWNVRRHRRSGGFPAGDESYAPEAGLVGAVEAEIGRRARPFRLVVTQLPVAEETGWRVARDHVLVSEGRRRNTSAYGEWLTPMIRELA
ncbi:hypothetical protein [Streptomyces sp. NPDC127033]|uniref:hypothetical protein n=1 Tax=Streptomyces sp. NPDC127033 TaxID=3347110 RepID=UPI003647BD71